MVEYKIGAECDSVWISSCVGGIDSKVSRICRSDESGTGVKETAPKERGFGYLLIIEPSVDITTTCDGINFPLACKAAFVACSNPPQQGTSIRTIVTL